MIRGLFGILLYGAVLAAASEWPPVFGQTVAESVTADCHVVPRPCDPTAYDSNNTEVIVRFTEVRNDGSCPNDYSLVRTWTAVDADGSESSMVQTVDVSDTAAPHTASVDVTTSVQCNLIPSMSPKVFADLCDHNVEVTSTETIENGGALIVRQWNAEDSCGNAAAPVTESLTVVDSVAPVIHHVQNETLSFKCHEAPTEPCEVSVTDNCDDSVVAVYKQTSTAGDCPHNYSMTQEWTATDDSGNTAVVHRSISVYDDEAPTINGVPDHLDLDCAQFVPTPHVTAYDNCDETVTVNSTEQSLGASCSNSFHTVTTYSATDSCGNTASADSTILVQDNEAPTLVNTPSVNETVSCDNVPPPAEVRAYDNCACNGKVDITPTYEETKFNEICEGNYTLTREWVATDCCGNNATFTQTLTVLDYADPEFVGVPSDETKECPSEFVPTPPNATDSCDTTMTVASDGGSRTDGDCHGNYTMVFTYATQDDCGHSISTQTTVSVSDNLAPEFEAPAKITSECDNVPDPADFLNATDACDAAVTNASLVSNVRTNGTCNDEYSMLRTWTATDRCGQSDTQTQLLEVFDTQEPTIVCDNATIPVEYLVFEIPKEWPVMNASDLCDASVVQANSNHNTTVHQDDPCLTDYVVTYDVTDNCGNVATTCTVTYEQRDTSDPTFNNSTLASIPGYSGSTEDGNITLSFSCLSEIAAPPLSVSDYADNNLYWMNAAAEGNVDTVTVFAVNPGASNCTNQAQYDIIYTALDDCGRTSQQTVHVSISDTASYQVKDSDPLGEDNTTRVNCSHTSDASVLASYEIDRIFDDNCDSSKTVSPVTSDINCTDDMDGEDGLCDHVKLLTWSVIDECSNTFEAVHTIIFVDNSDPVITCPEDRDVNCYGDWSVLTAEEKASVAVSDACTSSPEKSETTVDPASDAKGQCDTEWIRTYTVTDAVGKSASCSTTVTIVDEEAPSCNVPTKDITAECGSEPNRLILTCSDDCGAQPDQDSSGSRTADALELDGMDPRPEAVYYDSWVVTDACGLTSNYNQTVTIWDTTKPYVTGEDPMYSMPDESRACFVQDPPTTPLAEDDQSCSTHSSTDEYNNAEDNLESTCAPYTYTRSWSTTDQAGNTGDFASQYVSITGSNELSFSDRAFDDEIVEIGVDTVPEFVTVNASSECTGDIVPTCTVTRTNGTCAPEYVLTNNCTASSCAGEIYYVQTLDFQDTTPPQTPVLPDVPLDCSANASDYLAGGAQDVCAALQANDSDMVQCECLFSDKSCETCGGTYQRTLTCTYEDVCGNSNSTSAVYSWSDLEAPSITSPDDVTLDCADSNPTTEANVTDNCDADITVALESTTPASAQKSSATRYVYRKFASTDGAGNIATSTQTVTFVDTTNITQACVAFVGETNRTQEWHYTTVGGTSSNWPTGVARPVSTDAIAANCTCPNQVSDDCDDSPQVTCVIQKVEKDCAHNWDEIVTYTTSDDNGHSTSTSYTLQIRDTTPVEFINKGSFNEETHEISDIPEISDLTYTDANSNDTQSSVVAPPPHQNSSEFSRSANIDDDPDTPLTFKMVYTWTVKDVCQNVQTHNQTINVVDTEVSAPMPVPSDIPNQECSEPLELSEGDVEAVVVHFIADNGTVVTTSQDILYPDTNCSTDGYKLQVVRTFTATDESDNTNSSSYTITVIDGTLPSFVNAPDATRVVYGCNYSDSFDASTVTGAITGMDACQAEGLIQGRDKDDTEAFYTNGTMNATYEDTMIDGDNSDNETIVSRVYTIVDDCGNQRQTTEVVTVRDNQACVFETSEKGGLDAIANVTVDGCSPPPIPDLSCIDNCANTIVGEPSESVLGQTLVQNSFSDTERCSEHDGLVRTWEVYDNANNKATWAQTIRYNDTTSPYFITEPEDETIELCSGIPSSTPPTAGDNCSEHTVVLTTNYNLTGLEHGDTTYMTWTATDNCGNSDTYTKTISIVDTCKPTPEIPADYNITCGQSRPLEIANFTDCNCTADLFVGEIPDPEPFTLYAPDNSFCNASGHVYVRTWDVKDTNSEHDEVYTQTIIVTDDGAPQIPEPTHTTVLTCEDPAAENVTVRDCEVDTTVTSVVTHTVSLFQSYHTWTSTDACGSVSEQVKTVTHIDEEIPVINCTGCESTYSSCEDRDIPECVCTVTDNWDNCDGTQTTINTTMQEFNYTGGDGSCAGSDFMVRVYSAVDAYGNNATDVVQTISYFDAASPEFDSQPNATVSYECTPEEPEVLTASDLCDSNPSVNQTTYAVDLPEGQTAPYPYQQINKWTATDLCGNQKTIQQAVTVYDNTAPEFSVNLTDVTISCDESLVHPNITANDDNCGGQPNITGPEEDVISIECPFIAQYTWTATDATGNSETISYTVTITDEVGPSITGVSNQTQNHNCTDPAKPTANATDTCGTPGLNYTKVNLGASECTLHNYYHQWVATDLCGNTDTVRHTVIVEDLELPVFNCTSGCDVTEIEGCASGVMANPTRPIVVAVDNCNGVLPVSGSGEADSITGDICDGGLVHVYDFSTQDDCGQINYFSHTITLTDTENVTFGTLPDANVEKNCSETHTYPEIQTTECFYNSPTATGTVTANTTAIPKAAGSCDQEYTEYGYYSVSDNCGRVTTFTQTVHTHDNSTTSLADVVTLDTVTVECHQVPDAQSVTAPAEPAGCDANLAVDDMVEATEAGSCPEQYTITRTWSMSDDCGNSDSVTRTIEVQDTMAPQATENGTCADTTIECTDDIPQCTYTYDDRTGCDANTNDTFTEDTAQGTDDLEYFIYRAWNSCDACGNCVAKTQTIHVEDSVDPVVTVQPDATVEYGAVPNPYDGQANSTDNCDAVAGADTNITHTRQSNVSFTGSICQFNYYDIRCSKALDQSGNFHELCQTLTVEDTTPPSIHNVPLNSTVELGAVPAQSEAVDRIDARDSSGGVVTVSPGESSSPTAADGSYTLTRWVTAEDECQNSLTETWSVHVKDTTPPQFNQLPEHQTVQCDAIPQACTLSVVGEPSLDAAINQTENRNGDIIIRTWSVKDLADNEATYEQTITVVDSIAPVLSRMPLDEIVDCNCDAFPAAANVVVLDNCDSAANITMTPTTIEVDSPDQYKLVRTWFASDNSGNNVTHQQTVTVQDNEAPTLYPLPESTDVECEAVSNSVTSVSAIDNCDETAQANLTTTTIAGACPNEYTITHFWSATDRTGRTSNHTQIISVKDSSGPDINQLGIHCVAPADSALTSTFSFASLFSTNDNCDGPISVDFVSCNSTSAVEGDCVVTAGNDGVTVKAHPGYTYSVYVDGSDECGKSNPGKADIVIPVDAAALAVLGYEGCSVPV